MAKQHISVETFLNHLRTEVREPAGRMPDGRERAGFHALVAMALVGKVIESLPEMKLRDATEARDLVEEARETLGGILAALRDTYGCDGTVTLDPEPSLN